MTANTLNLPSATETPKPRSRVATAMAVIVGAFGTLLLLAGIGLAVAQVAADESDGYYVESADLSTDGYAIATNEIDLGGLAGVPSDLVGDVRVRAESADDGQLFVGIARAADVDRYLQGVEVSRVDDFGNDGDPKYEQVAGKAPAGVPAKQDFWLEQSQGAGQREVVWNPEPGRWSIVAMNADGSPGLAIDGDVGAKLGWLVWVEIGLGLTGLALIGGAIAIGRSRP